MVSRILGNAFISLEISSQFLILFSLFSFTLAWTFISLQIKEFWIMGLSINDSVYSCLFFFLTGLHFFHLLVGLLLISLLFWSCSFPYPVSLALQLNLRYSNWQFLENWFSVIRGKPLGHFLKNNQILKMYPFSFLSFSFCFLTVWS